jgi:hypothetical protein
MLRRHFWIFENLNQKLFFFLQKYYFIRQLTGIPFKSMFVTFICDDYFDAATNGQMSNFQMTIDLKTKVCAHMGMLLYGTRVMFLFHKSFVSS